MLALAVAVMDVCPTHPVPLVHAAVTNPFALIVATVGSLLVQLTDGFPELPSLKVPTTDICTVLLVVAAKMVGVAGPTAMEVSVAFGKNPVQLTSIAIVINAAKSPAHRIVCCLDFMV
jgi:hypothetical protein